MTLYPVVLCSLLLPSLAFQQAPANSDAVVISGSETLRQFAARLTPPRTVQGQFPSTPNLDQAVSDKTYSKTLPSGATLYIDPETPAIARINNLIAVYTVATKADRDGFINLADLTPSQRRTITNALVLHTNPTTDKMVVRVEVNYSSSVSTPPTGAGPKIGQLYFRLDDSQSRETMLAIKERFQAGLADYDKQDPALTKDRPALYDDAFAVNLVAHRPSTNRDQVYIEAVEAYNQLRQQLRAEHDQAQDDLFAQRGVQIPFEQGTRVANMPEPFRSQIVKNARATYAQNGFANPDEAETTVLQSRMEVRPRLALTYAPKQASPRQFGLVSIVLPIPR